VSRYIDQFRDRFGVEPICRTLAVAPSSYYAARRRPPSARAVADAELKLDIARVHRDQFGVYGARKLWRALRREGLDVGRDRVARLMGTLGLVGATRKRTRDCSGLARTHCVSSAAPMPRRRWPDVTVNASSGAASCSVRQARHQTAPSTWLF